MRSSLSEERKSDLTMRLENQFAKQLTNKGNFFQHSKNEYCGYDDGSKDNNKIKNENKNPNARESNRDVYLKANDSIGDLKRLNSSVDSDISLPNDIPNDFPENLDINGLDGQHKHGSKWRNNNSNNNNNNNGNTYVHKGPSIRFKNSPRKGKLEEKENEMNLNIFQKQKLKLSPRDKGSIYKFKFVLVGDASVGKSCIIRRYVMNKFSSINEVTIGMDISTKILKIDDVIVQLNIWDTASDERYSCLTRNFFTNVDCIILVYDILNIDSFNNITKRWANEIVENATTNPFVILVGNKYDSVKDKDKDKKKKQEKRVRSTIVDCKKAEKLANDNGWQFCQVSAKSGHCISSLFTTCTVATLINAKNRAKDKAYVQRQRQTITLNENDHRDDKGGKHRRSSSACCQTQHF